MLQESATDGSTKRHFRLGLLPVRSSAEQRNIPSLPYSPQRVAGAMHPPTRHKPKLLDQVREAIRTRHYSLRTEEA